MSKRSEDDYRSELIQSLNAMLPKPYRAHNSKTIKFEKGDKRAEIIGEKREFDIIIVDENFVSDNNINPDRIDVVIETKPLGSVLDGIGQAEDAFTAFPSLKETFATSFGDSLYHRARNEPGGQIKIGKKRLEGIVEEIACHITARVKHVAKPVVLDPIIVDEKKVITVLQDCMGRIQAQMTELPDESKIELTARTLVMWRISDDDKDASKLQYNVKRAASYIIIDQILFYDLLQRHNTKYPLSAMKKLDETDPPSLLYDRYMKRAIKVTGDYKPIFEIDVLSLLPETAPVVRAINDCIQKIQELHLGAGNTDFLGKIFHSMIPPEIRKNIAAYYTGSAPARLLALLAIGRRDMKVCDLACGSGTLLVESYHVLKGLYHASNPKLSDGEIHKQILENQIYGNDVTLFASHLSAMNLAAQYLNGEVTKINVTSTDGLRINPGGKPIYTARGLFRFVEANVDAKPERAVEMVVGDETGVIFPRVDCVIMNPPFSRQKDMSKETLENLKDISTGWFPIDKSVKKGQEQERDKYIDAKMGLHGYFIIHADHLLAKDGTIAMVLSSSTFTTDYTEKILAFLKSRRYSIEYVIEILSKRSTFSEGCTFKEYMVVCRKGALVKGAATRMVSLKGEIGLDQVSEISHCLQGGENHPSFVVKQIQTELLYGSSKWSELFSGTNDVIGRTLSSPLLENYEDNSSGIKISPGFHGTYAEYLMLPNDEWTIARLNPETFRIEHVTLPEGDAQRSCQVPEKYIVPAIRNSESANNFIVRPNCFALNLPPELPKDLIDFQRKYIHWAEGSLESKWEKHRKDGHKRVDIVKVAIKKDGKYVETPWFSHAWKNKCDQVKNELLIAKKYRGSLRRNILVFSPNGGSSITNGFGNIFRSSDSKFYASYGQSVIFFISQFLVHRSISKGYWEMMVGDYNDVKFPKYADFGDATKADLIAKWQALADVPDAPFLPQQFGADKIIKGKTTKGVKQPDTVVHHDPLPERVALDNAWLEAIGIPANETDTTRQELYKWLIEYMETR